MTLNTSRQSLASSTVPAENSSPAPALRFGLTPAQVKKTCEAATKQFLVEAKALAKLDPAAATFETVVARFDRILIELSNNTNSTIFMKDVSDDEKVRNSATECSEKLGQMLVDLYAREDLYAQLKAVEAKKEALTTEQARLLEEMVSRFRRNGLELSKKDRAKFIAKRKEIITRSERFQKRVNASSKEFVLAKASEMEGVPQEIVDRLKKTRDGKFKVVMDKATVLPVLENGKSEALRKRVDAKFASLGGPANVRDFEETLRLRHETAVMLGYPTHAHYVLDRRVAKTPEKVDEFLQPLIKRLKVKAEAEMNELEKLKAAETQTAPSKTEIQIWDWRYYMNQLKKQRYQVDGQKIKEYFPLPTVLKGMLQIFETLFTVRFEETKGPTWHPSVQLLKVWRGNDVIAHIYLDLFPRPGKYNHFAAFDLLLGYQGEHAYQKPIAAIVGNFSPPGENTPSLLEHEEVETLFHEFGHIMHQTLTKARYGTFSGANVLWDFVEAPSQMLENYVWNPESLSLISGNYRNPSEKLPKEQIDRMLAARFCDAGLGFLRQASFATIDLRYHTAEKTKGKTTKMYSDTIEEVFGLAPQRGTMTQASFGHLMGSYDAGYYGYLYSKVFAEDMFTRFVAEGIFSPTVGKRYLENILEPGGSEDPMLLVKKFLGREPSHDAFLKSLGLN